ncbi:MAG: response regulator [Ilumatobacter sp.]|jgi:DNA-binding NarL/FixJ family response regulator|uniref:response regulator n=1 Tax=Ilumatobacter sp. TaxID=1967498 RepID=UPI0039193526
MSRAANRPAIRVVLADDHPVVRAGIGQIVTADGDIEVIAEATTGREAVSIAVRERPDVVLMDLRMPELDGVGAIAELAVAAPAVNVLVLTTYDTDDQIVGAVEAGAIGYLLKDTEPDELRNAVREAAAGQTVLSAPVASRLVQQMRQTTSVTLTPREREILTLVADGLSNAEIAARLHVGRATVKTHLLHVFEKLGVNDRTAAVVTALKQGIISPPR